MDWMAPAPQELGSSWSQTKQGGGQSTSLELERKGEEERHSREARRDFLLRVGNSLISSAALELSPGETQACGKTQVV